MNDFRLLFHNSIYLAFSETLSLNEFPEWERIHHEELMARFSILARENAPETRAGYSSWAQSRFIIASYNHETLMFEIEELTKPAIFSGRTL